MIPSLDLLATRLLVQLRILFAYSAARAGGWLVLILVPTRAPRIFAAKLLPSLCWCLGLYLPGCRTLQFDLLNFVRFLSALSAACPGPTGWQHDPLVHQSLLPVTPAGHLNSFASLYKTCPVFTQENILVAKEIMCNLFSKTSNSFSGS